MTRSGNSRSEIPVSLATASSEKAPTIPDANPNAIDISHHNGANLMLKACDFVRCSVQGADKWEWSKVHEHASALVRSKRVTATI